MVRHKTADKVCTRQEAEKSVWRVDLGFGGEGKEREFLEVGRDIMYKGLKKNILFAVWEMEIKAILSI